MKRIFIYLTLITLGSHLFGQADTFMVKTYFNHYLSGKGYLTKRYAVEQITMDPQGKSLRTFLYDNETTQMTKFIYYFYPQPNTIIEEHFAAPDSLLFFKKIETNGADPQRITYYSVQDKSLTTDSILDYSYEQGHITEIRHLNSKGKVKLTEVYSYSNAQQIQQIDYQYTKFNIPSIYRIVEAYTYNEDVKKPIEKKISRYSDKKSPPVITIEKYTYKNDLLIRIDYFDAMENLIKYQENKYLGEQLSGIDIKKPDNDGYLQHQVIIYKNHVINFGNRPSHYHTYQTEQ